MFNFVEPLENRRLLSAGHGHGHAPAHDTPHGNGHAPKPPKVHVPPGKQAVALHGRNLMIKGTSGDDVVTVAPDAADPTLVDVTFNGVTSMFSMSRIKRIQADLKAGNDTMTVDPAITIRTDIHGGDGNDTLAAGSGKSKLMGGAGDDNLTGGSANDMLLGGDGADSLNGGDGDDKLDGGDGVDSITGGSGSDHFTSHDSESEKMDVGTDDNNSVASDDQNDDDPVTPPPAV
jgi:Ca2+-binding RTX toxin-like protein